MHCCEPTIVEFMNVEQTNVTYSNQIRQKHGDVPRVDVLYFNPDTGKFDFDNMGFLIKLQGSPVNNIHIDHGGRFSGIIKIL